MTHPRAREREKAVPGERSGATRKPAPAGLAAGLATPEPFSQPVGPGVSGDVLPRLDRPARAAALLGLQRRFGNQATRAVVQRLPTKPPTFSGTVFLPGDEHLGEQYTVEGGRIVKKSGKKGEADVAVANVDEAGNYFLLDALGEPAKSPSGNLKDLLGNVHVRGPHAAPTTTASAGHFSLEGADGKAVALDIKAGGVYTADKPPKLVGTVSATGEYAVRLGDTVQKGSLEQLPVGKAQFQGARQVEGKAQPGLAIETTAISTGVAFLDGAKLNIKNGHFFRDGGKTPVGEVALVQTLDGKEKTTKALPYRYTDDKDKEHTGDLLKDAGEQSQYRVGNDFRVRVGASWEDPGQLKKYGPYHGFAKYGGGPLKTKLADLKAKKKLEITDEEIGLFDAIADVESGGSLQGINSYDNMVMSFGFKQWTLGTDSELPEIISRAASAFSRYGIELEGNYTIAGRKTRGIKGVADKEDLRGPYWAERFFEAGLDDDIIAVEVQKAREDLQGTLKIIKRSPHLSSAAGTRLLLELQNNRPAYQVPAVNRSLGRAAADIGEDDFLEILTDEIVREYANHPALEGSARKGADKALHWTRTILTGAGHGTLADKVAEAWKDGDPTATKAAAAAKKEEAPAVKTAP
jgi:hypothetical protein